MCFGVAAGAPEVIHGEKIVPRHKMRAWLFLNRSPSRRWWYGHSYCDTYVVQWFMQDENVACHDLGKVSLDRAVGCFGTPQLERATRFPMSQLERGTRFPNVPSRACDSLSNVPILARMISSSKSVYSGVFFYNNYFFVTKYLSSNSCVYVLIVLIKA